MTALSIHRSGAFIPQLTGIRCFAATMVLLLHGWQAVSSYENPIIARGYLGVDLFFLLSGYIIAHVYAERFEHSATHEFFGFLWHRFARLYPAHVTVLAILVLALGCAMLFHIPLGDPGAWGGQQLLWQLLLIQSWGVTDHIGWNAVSWSVSSEWFAYLLFPPVAFLITRLSAGMAALVALCALAVLFEAYTLFHWDVRSSWSGARALSRVSSEFICGVALWRCLTQTSLPRHVPDALGFGCIISFIVGAAFGVSDFVLIAILALFVVAAATSTGAFSRFLSARALVWVGEISYSIYLVHFLVVRIAHKGLEHFTTQPSLATKLTTLVLACAVSIGLAAILYYWVERPARGRLLAWQAFRMKPDFTG